MKFGNIFSLDVGPDYAGRLREIDVQTLRQVGEMIRSQAPDPSVPPPLKLPPPAEPVPAQIEIADGPFQPTWESLQQYQCPDWFRDAKLGIWGILGAAIAARGRRLVCAAHVYRGARRSTGSTSTASAIRRSSATRTSRRCGRPGKFDPDRLMTLYKQAGAKYFVVLANHHDNWDNWNSKYHRWNSVNMGPKKDIVGLVGRRPRKQARPAVRRHRASGPQLQLVQHQQRQRQEGPAGRRALRRQRSATSPTCTSRRTPTPATATRQIRRSGGRGSGSGACGTCSTPTSPT